MAARVVEVKFDQRDAKRAAAEAAREFQSAFDRIRAGTSTADAAIGGLSARVNGLTSAFRGLASIGAASILTGIASGITAVAVASLKAAADIDKSRQTLIALTGSTDAANRKLAELRKLAQSSPGVTVSLANEAFAQLKATGQVADQTINNLIRSVGRLNAVFTIDDPKGFTRNLQQIFNQGFERADIKEALGRVPIFEQLLEQAFGTKDANKLRKLKESGKLTIDTFLDGVSGAINNDPRLANIQESIGARFEKLKDSILTSLAPVGEQIANILLPLLQQIAPEIEKASNEIAGQLQGSKGEFDAVTEASRQLLESINDIAGKSDVSLNLRKDFSLTAQVLVGINIALNALRDVVEIVANAAKAAIQVGLLGPLGLVKEALGLIGIEFQKLNGFVEFLKNGVTSSFDRLGLGFVNAERAERQAGIVTGGLTAAEEARTNTGVFPRRSEVASRFANEKSTVGSLQAQIDFIRAQTEAEERRRKVIAGGGKTASDSQARAARAAELALQKSDAENELKLTRESLSRRMKAVQDSYDEQKISTKQFYEDKLLLDVQGLDAEVKAIDKQIAVVEATITDAKGETERNRLNEQLGDLITQKITKQGEILDAFK
jgi:hypothetical protein